MTPNQKILAGILAGIIGTLVTQAGINTISASAAPVLVRDRMTMFRCPGCPSGFGFEEFGAYYADSTPDGEPLGSPIASGNISGDLGPCLSQCGACVICADTAWITQKLADGGNG